MSQEAFRRQQLRGLLVAFALLPLGLAAQERGHVARINCQICYEYSKRSPWSLWTKKKVKVCMAEPHRASCFLLSYQGKSYVVTAKHVLIGPSAGILKLPNGDKVDLADPKLMRTSRIKIGTLAFKPEKTAVSKNFDLAVMTLSEEDTRALGVVPLKPLSKPISPRALVEAWGFPGTSGAQRKIGLPVSEVRASDGYFVISAALVGGFSGGPILTEDGDAAGVIYRTEGGKAEKQSRAILINRALRLIGNGDWKYYEDGMAFDSRGD